MKYLFVAIFALQLLLITQNSATADGPNEKTDKLIAIRIRAASSQEVADLRKMHLDITRVFPDPDSPTTEHSLSGGFILEAVVTRGLMAKLRSKGYDVEQMKGVLKENSP